MYRKVSIAVIVALVLVLASCDLSFLQPPESADSQQLAYGTLKLTLGNVLEAKMLPMDVNVSSIKYYEVVIKGDGITPISETSVPASGITTRTFTVKATNNIIVKLTPLDIYGDPVIGTLTAKVAIYGYGDIEGDVTQTIYIAWNRTPVARVLEKMLQEGYEIAPYNPVPLQNEVDAQISNSDINALAVDIETIANNVMANETYTTVNMDNTATVIGTVSHASGNISDLFVTMNAPFVAPSTTDSEGNFSFTNVAPGAWLITVSDGGSATVTVDTNGAVTPATTEILKGNNHPIIYGYGISTLTENGVYKTIIGGEVGDLDGIEDISSVSILMPTGYTPSLYALQDDGTGEFFDSISTDGVFESKIEMQFPTGMYKFRVVDQAGGTTDYDDTFTLTYLVSPTITTIQDGDTITDRTPLIQWNPVSGAQYYRFYLVSDADGTIVYQNENTTSPTAVQINTLLTGGAYTIRLFAHSAATGYRQQISYRSIGFTIDTGATVQGAASLQLDLGDEQELFFSDYDGTANTYRIQKLDIRTGTAMTIVPALDSWNDFADLSSDGREILYFERQGSDRKLYRMSVNGTRRFLLSSRTNINYPVWSPDMSMIAFCASNGIYIIDSDGTDERLIASGWTNRILFSADSSRIFYTDHSLFSVNTDGTDYQSYNIGISVNETSLSPDGQKLLFQSNSAMYDYGIYTIGVDGSGLLKIVSSQESVSYPRWTPDGRVIYISNSLVYMVDGNGQNQTEIYVNGVGSVHHAQVSPTGKKIIFAGHNFFNGGNYLIGRCNLDGTMTEQLNSTGMTGSVYSIVISGRVQ